MSLTVEKMKCSQTRAILIRHKSLLPLIFIFVYAFSISIGVHGYVVDSILICDDVNSVTSDPIGESDVYLTDNEDVYCWVNFTEISVPHIVRFDWLNPDGELIESHTKDIEDPVFDFIEIYGNDPASDPGEWSVRVYVDNILRGTETFSIVDYDTVVEKTNLLESQIADITSTFEQLLTNIDSIRADYQELLIEYNELSDSYEELTNDYNDQIEDYNTIAEEKNTLQQGYNDIKSDYDELASETDQLSDDYNSLLSEYDSIDKQLGNSRTMMYASVGLAVICLGIAAYFYIKR
jgi:hypothetical protein